FNTSAGNPVKEILLKLNLPYHRSILTDSKIHIKMDMERRSVKIKELQERCPIQAFKIKKSMSMPARRLQVHKLAKDHKIDANSLFSYGFQVGESVLMRPSGERKAPYVARVQRFVGDAKGNVNAIVEWYYRPEETIAGRKPFH
ncbi:bromo adjacent homology domain, zinc finger, RING/FYVE/PHD-type containing protein, partial [Tanacetum coccineum]